VDAVAVLVGQHLYLDVARVLDVLLDVDVAVLERGGRLRRGRAHGGGELFLRADDAHPAPAAAGRGLDDDGVADLARERRRLLFRLQRVGAARQDGEARLLHRAARLDLVAHHADDVGARADELDVARLADFSELRRLGEEAVAGVDGVHVRDLGGGDDRGDVEVALLRSRAADADGLVREADVQRVAVGRRMHGDRLDAHLLARPDDAARDLAAVRDQDFAESSHE
jgi:hypothetical protein